MIVFQKSELGALHESAELDLTEWSGLVSCQYIGAVVNKHLTRPIIALVKISFICLIYP